MRLRQAEERDIPALARVAAAAYRHAFSAILEPQALASFDLDCFTRRFARDWPKIVLAQDDDAVIGFALVSDETLRMLFVRPDRLGAGTGARLLRAAMARGARRLETFHANEAARAFYERHGWRAVRAYVRPFAGRERAFVEYALHPDGPEASEPVTAGEFNPASA